MRRLLAVALVAAAACRSAPVAQPDPEAAAQERALAALRAAAGADAGDRDLLPGVPGEKAAATALSEQQRRQTDARRDERRRALLRALDLKADALAELLRADDYDGPLQAGRALEAYADERELQAVLLAQAAVGADPGNRARRRLLSVLERLTELPADKDGLLPLPALVDRELRKAGDEFFLERFGEAIQACRRALLLDPANAQAWLRLGSAHYALGERDRARAAYRRAAELAPADERLRRFLAARGLE